MAKHGYVLTFNSEYFKEVNEVANAWHEQIIIMAISNTEKMNRATKAHPEETRFYRYIAIGPIEIGKKEGRIHCHGYIYCNKQKTIKGLLKDWPRGTHFDAAKGNTKQIITYLTKGKHDKQYAREHPEVCSPLAFEDGDQPQQGARSDLAGALDAYNNIEEFMTEEPELYCKYRNGIKDIYALKSKNEKRYYEPVEVIWSYGETGTGKTRAAFEDVECVNVDYNNGFFSDWGQAKTISLEEMNGSIPYKTLLKLLDGYHNYYNVNIKGGQKLVNLKKIYITSSEHPANIYKRQNEKDGSINQLLRRCTKIIYHTIEGTKDVTKDRLATIHTQSNIYETF